MMEAIWIIVAAAAGVLGSALVLYTGTILLRRTIAELQYGLADLEDRLVREVKKRAAAARWDEEPSAQELKQEMKEALDAGTGFLSPTEFARRKRQRRLKHGPEDREIS